MAGSYNKITLVGNLTKDPEKRLVNEKTVTKFSIAVNRKTKAGDEAMFIDIIAWDRLGDISAQYLTKGMSVLVEGRLSMRKYQDKEGNNRIAVEVVANEMVMLDKKGAPVSGNGAAPAEPAAEMADDDLLSIVPF
jgi:single-strand DNA-binding protein